MPTPVTDLASPKGIGNPVVGIYGPALRAFPLTAAVALGPLITIVYRLTQSSDAALGSFSLAQAVRGLLCLLMLLSLYFARGLHRVTHRLVRPLFFLAAYAVATAALGPYPYQNIVAAVKLVFISLVFLNALQLAAAGVVRERWLTACAWAILLIMAICIGLGLMTGDTSVGYTSRYATAGLMNHISIASFFVLSTLPVFLRDTVVSRSAVTGVGIVWLLLFFTMCRTALITAVAGTCGPLLLGLTRLGSRIPRRKVLVWLGLFLLLTAIGLSTAPGAELTARFRELNPYAGSGSGRYTFWKISLEHILHRPVSAQLWGDGMGSTRDVLKARFGLPIGCHNDWLEFVTAFGVCGLVGMGWWHFELLRLAWRFRRRQEGLSQGVWAAAIVLVLISLGTGGSFDPVWALTYAALGFWAGHTVWAQQSGSTDARARLWFVPKVALLTLLTLLGLGIAGWYALEEEPLPFEPVRVSPEERQRLIDMIHSKSPKSLRGDQTHTLHLTEHQISALLFWSPLSDPHRQKVAVRLDHDSISLSLSRPISLGRGEPHYLNLDVTGTVAVRDGVLKFRADRCRMGTIGFPPWLLHALSPLATLVLNQDQRARLIARATREIRVEPGSMQVTYGPLDVSPGRPGRLPRSSLVKDALRASLRAQVDHLLLLFAADSDPDPEPSFNLCLKTAFALARERSTRGNAAPENRAAIFALGVLLGHPQMEDFVGSILRDEDREKAQQVLSRVLLHGRSDWTRHFCVSAALTALSDQTISAACGALKEELDAQTGGSGFSFADTLADRAGTVFAVQATRNEAAARALQDRLAGGFRIEEVCPPAADLPEGISEADLQSRYGGVGGEGYRQLLAEIERRVAACAAYR